MPLTAYQRHVKAFAKTYRGPRKSLFKAAARAWRGKGRKKTTKSANPRRKRSSPTRRRTVSRKGKLFGSIGGMGALEDLGVGFIGGMIFRGMGQGANAVPATRIIQGVVGHAAGRRGKRHLVQGIIDYVDNYLLEMVGMGVGRARAAPTISSLVRKIRI